MGSRASRAFAAFDGRDLARCRPFAVLGSRCCRLPTRGPVRRTSSGRATEDLPGPRWAGLLRSSCIPRRRPGFVLGSRIFSMRPSNHAPLVHDDLGLDGSGFVVDVCHRTDGRHLRHGGGWNHAQSQGSERAFMLGPRCCCSVASIRQQTPASGVHQNLAAGARGAHERSGGEQLGEVETRRLQFGPRRRGRCCWPRFLRRATWAMRARSSRNTSGRPRAGSPRRQRPLRRGVLKPLNRSGGELGHLVTQDGDGVMNSAIFVR